MDGSPGAISSSVTPATTRPLIVEDKLNSFVWVPLKGDPRFEALQNDPRNQQPLY